MNRTSDKSDKDRSHKVTPAGDNFVFHGIIFFTLCKQWPVTAFRVIFNFHFLSIFFLAKEKRWDSKTELMGKERVKKDREERENLVLWKAPVGTISNFVAELFSILCKPRSKK